MKNEHKNIYRYLGWILLFAAVIIGFCVFDDYGMSFDEVIQRKTGMISYDYVLNNSSELLTWKDRDYGVAYELPLVVIEKILNMDDTRDIFLLRHLITHVLFIFGGLSCYCLSQLLYKNRILSCLGFLIFILHPRIYAHSFFNTKDIPFLVMQMVCLCMNGYALKKPSVGRYISLGIALGVLINLRIMGILLLCVAVLCLMLNYFGSQNRQKGTFLYALILMIVCPVTLYVTWPFLWPDPVGNFLLAFENMSHFRWGGNVLFNGEMMSATSLCWYYVPVWFAVTTPVYILLSGGIGIFVFVVRDMKDIVCFKPNFVQLNNLAFLICFFAPVLAVIVLGSTLYDGWRQLYFIYPSFVMLTILGIHKMLSTRLKVIALVFVVLGAGVTLVSMITLHPYQNVFFNSLVDRKEPNRLRRSYELDYWGTSYAHALECILASDPSDSVNVIFADALGTSSVYMLPKSERERIRFVSEIENADYYVTLYKRHPGRYVEMEPFLWKSINVYSNAVCSIFKKPQSFTTD